MKHMGQSGQGCRKSQVWAGFYLIRFQVFQVTGETWENPNNSGRVSDFSGFSTH